MPNEPEKKTSYTELPESPLSAIANYAMDLVESQDLEHPEGYKVGEIIVVVEILPEGEVIPHVEVNGSEHRPYVMHAILKVAALASLNVEEDEPAEGVDE